MQVLIPPAGRGAFSPPWESPIAFPSRSLLPEHQEIAAHCLPNCFEDSGPDFGLRRAIYPGESQEKEGESVAKGYAAAFSAEQTRRDTDLRLGSASGEI